MVVALGIGGALFFAAGRYAQRITREFTARPAALAACEVPVYQMAFSPAGNAMASARDSHDIIYLWNWPARELRHELKLSSDFFLGNLSCLPCTIPPVLRFSPDGASLAVVQGRTLGVWDVASGRATRLLVGPPSFDFRNAHWMRDGRHLLLTGGKGASNFLSLTTVDVATGDYTTERRDTLDAVTKTLLLPDDSLVTAGPGYPVEITCGVVERRDAGFRKLWSFAQAGELHDIGASPDGRFIAVAQVVRRYASDPPDQAACSVKLLDAQTGTQRAQFDQVGVPLGLDISRDRVAVQITTSYMRPGDYYLLTLPGLRCLGLRPARPHEAAVRFWPDALHLATFDTCTAAGRVWWPG